MKLCFATTAHKFQGQTVVKPKKIAVDLKTVFASAQTYVMLSRVQSIEQLFILNSLDKDKFYADGKALEELDRLNNKSMNNNPPAWEQKNENFLKIFSLNCQSLRGKISHIQNDKIVIISDIICLSETWLLSDENTDDIQIGGYVLCANGVGHGKGIATYFRQNIFKHVKDVKGKYYQLTKLKSESLDVVSVYRSQEGHIDQLLDTVTSIIDLQKQLCYAETSMFVTTKTDPTIS